MENAMMQAMVLREIGQPLALEERGIPKVREGQVLIKVSACGVCRTDLHVFDGDLTGPKLPLILGHEVVAQVARTQGRKFSPLSDRATS